MLFNSLEYFIFLPIVLCLYWVSSHTIQNRLLLLASYFFYGLWDIRFLFLIILSTSVDYLVGILIDKDRLLKLELLKSTAWLFLSATICLVIDWPQATSSLLNISELSIDKFGLQIFGSLAGAWLAVIVLVSKLPYKLELQSRRKFYVAISIVVNLAILAFFKYFNFFIDNAESIIQGFGWNVDSFYLNIVLPVGISFYTFQTMSYSIDLYRGKLKSTNHFFDFALFVAYFPQLVAGPIERASNLLPIILKKRKVDRERVYRGITLIFLGLFKKIAIADGVAMSVNSVYNSTGNASPLDIFLATILFAIQIYCDFSAYSDIARGSSKLLGIELMRNFNLPYFSTNPSEFWRRWHISLSSWLRDYLYIPLGGNRGSGLATYRNLSVTMLLGGLWHGAAWNYILWGAYQGGILSIHRYFTLNKAETKKSVINLVMSIVIFFLITCYGWLLFRANSFEQILAFTEILIFDWGDWTVNMKKPTFAAILALPILFCYEFFEYKSKDIRFYKVLPLPILAVGITAITWLIAMGLSNEPVQFIYFQF